MLIILNLLTLFLLNSWISLASSLSTVTLRVLLIQIPPQSEINLEYIIFQDESIKAWKAGRHGKKIQNTAIGGIISALKKKAHTSVMVDKFFPSTQLCPVCKAKNKLPVWQRTYNCSCGYTEDRDLKSAQCIETEGLKTLISTERRNTMLRDTETSVSTIFSTLENIVDVSNCRKAQLAQSSHYSVVKDLKSLPFMEEVVHLFLYSTLFTLIPQTTCTKWYIWSFKNTLLTCLLYSADEL